MGERKRGKRKRLPSGIEDYIAVRRLLQDDGDRFRSSVVAENPSVEISDEQLLNLASEILAAEDSVSSNVWYWQAYTKASFSAKYYQITDYPVYD